MALTKVTSGLISADASSVDLNIDAGTLYIDSTNNRVGVANTSPSATLDVNGTATISGASTAGFVTPLLAKNPSTNAASSVKIGLDAGGTTWGEIGASYNTNDPYMAFFVRSGSEKVRITDAGNVGIGTSSPDRKFSIHDTSNAYNLELRQTSAYNSGNQSGIVFSAIYDSSNNPTDLASIRGGKENTTDGNYGGNLRFYTRPNGGSDTERMRIDSSGNVLVGTTATTPSNGIVLYKDATRGILRVATSTTAADAVAEFYNPNGKVGQIVTNGSATSYNTSSDYRLKENVIDMDGAIDRVKALQPKRFNFIADADTTVDGFLAHEVSEVIPEAITGEKDAVNEDGTIKAQGIDQSKLVPLLTGALKEAIAKIETLEARITALENA